MSPTASRQSELKPPEQLQHPTSGYSVGSDDLSDMPQHKRFQIGDPSQIMNVSEYRPLALTREDLARKGLAFDEQQPLKTLPFLGIDESARRKGHRYDTILCDLETYQVLEVSAGRKHEEVIALLERLSDPDAVKAVSMDMTASFRPAVHLCLPRAHSVVDHFHVIQHVMKGFKKVLYSWAHKKDGEAYLYFLKSY